MIRDSLRALCHGAGDVLYSIGNVCGSFATEREGWARKVEELRGMLIEAEATVARLRHGCEVRASAADHNAKAGAELHDALVAAETEAGDARARAERLALELRKADEANTRLEAEALTATRKAAAARIDRDGWASAAEAAHTQRDAETKRADAAEAKLEAAWAATGMALVSPLIPLAEVVTKFRERAGKAEAEARRLTLAIGEAQGEIVRLSNPPCEEPAPAPAAAPALTEDQIIAMQMCESTSGDCRQCAARRRLGIT